MLPTQRIGQAGVRPCVLSLTWKEKRGVEWKEENGGDGKKRKVSDVTRQRLTEELGHTKAP